MTIGMIATFGIALTTTRNGRVISARRAQLLTAMPATQPTIIASTVPISAVTNVDFSGPRNWCRALFSGCQIPQFAGDALRRTDEEPIHPCELVSYARNLRKPLPQCHEGDYDQHLRCVDEQPASPRPAPLDRGRRKGGHDGIAGAHALKQSRVVDRRVVDRATRRAHRALPPSSSPILASAGASEVPRISAHSSCHSSVYSSL